MECIQEFLEQGQAEKALATLLTGSSRSIFVLNGLKHSIPQLLEAIESKENTVLAWLDTSKIPSNLMA